MIVAVADCSVCIENRSAMIFVGEEYAVRHQRYQACRETGPTSALQGSPTRPIVLLTMESFVSRANCHNLAKLSGTAFRDDAEKAVVELRIQFSALKTEN